MKILYICADPGVPVLGRKGASVHVRQMIEAMKARGHQVVLAAQKLQKSPWDSPAVLNVPVIEIKPNKDLLAAAHAIKEFSSLLGMENSFAGDVRRILYNKELESDLVRRFESNPPDLIYERGSLYGVAGISASRRLKCPIIIELNAPLTLEQSAYRGAVFGPITELCEKWMLNAASKVFVVSQNLKEHVAAFGIAEDRVRVVPNGVDLARFSPAQPDPVLREKLGLHHSRVIGFVGGLRPWHGVEMLPELLSALAHRVSDIKMVIVGDGPLRSSLTAAFAEKNLLEKVRFTGAQDHEAIPSLIRQFDLAVAPYPILNHSFYFSPLKLFEYLGCGIPTVAADVGQISEILTHRQTGWLYPPGNLEALTEGCAELLANPALARQISQAGVEMVYARYTWDKNVRVLEEEVLKLKTGPAA